MSGLGGRGLPAEFLGSVLSNDIPPDVRTQVFAPDLPTGGVFDQRAVLRRDFALRLFPLVDRSSANAQQGRNRGLRTENFCGFFDNVHHTSRQDIHDKYRNARPFWQENLDPPGIGRLYSRRVELKEWVRAARQHAQLTQEQLGEQLNVTKGNVSGWENGRHQPSYDQVAKIASATKYAMPSVMQQIAARGLPPLALDMVDRASAAPSMVAIRAWEHPEDLPPGEYVFIPRLDFHLSAGAGLEQMEIEFNEQQPQAFRADWIRKEGLRPAKLASMYAKGNSMEPSIWDGDTLVIDTSQHDVIDGKVYALWYEGGERVKRLYRLPGGGLRIRSDNAAEHPEIILGPEHRGDVRIIGRVVHRAGKGGL